MPSYRKLGGGRSGVSQLLDRTTYLASLSHMRRVTKPSCGSQPHFEARDLHPTHWGRLCPNETPGSELWTCQERAQMIDVSEEVPEDDVKELLVEAESILTQKVGLMVLGFT